MLVIQYEHHHQTQLSLTSVLKLQGEAQRLKVKYYAFKGFKDDHDTAHQSEVQAGLKEKLSVKQQVCQKENYN